MTTQHKETVIVSVTVLSPSPRDPGELTTLHKETVSVSHREGPGELTTQHKETVSVSHREGPGELTTQHKETVKCQCVVSFTVRQRCVDTAQRDCQCQSGVSFSPDDAVDSMINELSPTNIL